MATIQHRSMMVMALLAAAVLAMVAGCDGENDDQRPPAAAEGPPAAQMTATPRASPAPIPVTGPAATLPIIDLHFHPVGWDVPGLVKLFDELGVARAGNGTANSDSSTLFLARQHANWFLPFAGQGTIGTFVRSQSERALNLESPAVLEYLDQLEADLRAGHFKGIGELLANSLGSSPGLGTRYPADSPLMQRLWALSATYQVPLSVHMDATEESVAEMEQLLVSDRRGA